MIAYTARRKRCFIKAIQAGSSGVKHAGLQICRASDRKQLESQTGWRAQGAGFAAAKKFGGRREYARRPGRAQTAVRVRAVCVGGHASPREWWGEGLVLQQRQRTAAEPARSGHRASASKPGTPGRAPRAACARSPQYMARRNKWFGGCADSRRRYVGSARSTPRSTAHQPSVVKACRHGRPISPDGRFPSMSAWRKSRVRVAEQTPPCHHRAERSSSSAPYGSSRPRRWQSVRRNPIEVEHRLPAGHHGAAASHERPARSMAFPTLLVGVRCRRRYIYSGLPFQITSRPAAGQ